jgi:hypothetical protein
MRTRVLAFKFHRATRERVSLERSTMCDGVRGSTDFLEVLADAIGRHVMAGVAIHADDTPVKVLAPGTGRTKTGRLWVYLRDERDWTGDPHPAAFYKFTPDRRGQWPRDHLKDFSGWLHADGYAGFEELYRRGGITEVACLAHIRRKFFDIHVAQGSGIAKEALERCTGSKLPFVANLPISASLSGKNGQHRSSTILKSGFTPSSHRSRVSRPWLTRSAMA